MPRRSALETPASWYHRRPKSEEWLRAHHVLRIGSGHQIRRDGNESKFPDDGTLAEMEAECVSRHARGRPAHVRLEARARSCADSHQPGKFSCPEVQSYVVKALHRREGGRSHQPRSSEVASDFGQCFPGPQEDDLEVVALLEQFERSRLPSQFVPAGGVGRGDCGRCFLSCSCLGLSRGSNVVLLVRTMSSLFVSFVPK